MMTVNLNDMIVSVLVPNTLVDTNFVSSTAAETDYTAYNSGTTYAVGERCISTTTHRIYESLVAGNIGHDPTNINNRAGLTTTYWLDAAPTNKFACLDNQVSTQTVVASPLTMVFTPGFFNGLALVGMSGDNLVVTVKDATGGNVIFSHNAALENSLPPDYFEYFFAPFSPQTDFVVTDIAPYYNAEVTITITAASGNVACGMVQFGDFRQLGGTKYGAKAKPKSFSTIRINDYGENEITRRRKGQDLSLSAEVELEDVNYVNDTILGLLDIPAFWIGSTEAQYAALRSFGLGGGEITFDRFQKCILNVDVKGLI